MTRRIIFSVGRRSEEATMAKQLALKQRIKEATETGRAKILKFEEEAQKLVKKVVEKGRDAQEEGLKRFEELVAKAPIIEKVREADLIKRVRALRSEVEERIEGGMEKLLDAFGVPSKEQLEKLTKRLDSLSTRVGELAKAQKLLERALRHRRAPAKK
jgi:polyhydroxyalkanoate synthesis regulator phasin